MADARTVVIQAFQRRIANSPFLDGVDEHEARRLGREAAEVVLRPLVWRHLLGEDRLDTTQVARLLGVTRQAIHKRVQAGHLFGVPGRGTTWFPAWQFDVEGTRVYPVVPQLLTVWNESLGPEKLDPVAILSWSRTPQPELDGRTPDEWIALGKPDAEVLEAARQAAQALAT
jgi:hypothetical protein